ncbi:GRIP domain-containing protein [Exophiala dermatitidis]
MSSTNAGSMPPGDQKSKKKKKSKKKGNTAPSQSPAVDTSTIPVEAEPEPELEATAENPDVDELQEKADAAETEEGDDAQHGDETTSVGVDDGGEPETADADANEKANEKADQEPEREQNADAKQETQRRTQRQDTYPTVAVPETRDTTSSSANLTNGVANATRNTEENDDDTSARFDALVKDRDVLRAEVSQLRQSLEELRSKHAAEIETVQTELAETQAEKESAEEQYQSLLGKVNTIRSQLGERLKADAEDLAQARTQIEELEEQKSELQERYTARSAEVEELTARNQELTTKVAEQSKELSSLRNRMTLAQQNWLKEKEELVEQEAYMREEFENAKQAMHDWEVLAMEERTVRRDLTDRNADLEEQVSTLKEAYEKAVGERDINAATVDGLQKALHEIQTVRKQELKELVEASQKEQDELRAQLQELQTKHDATQVELEQTKKELERALPFEKEVKEKNLLIGKLRHEAVILNDHLTKALRFLKKGKPEDNVDRQIVTNHFLQFLALDRADPKKFQVLQLIAALLGWTEEQREQAGLARPGAHSSTGGSTSNLGSLRLPGSPLVHRTPSTPALHHEYFGPDSMSTPGASSKESLAELWQHFLEQEAGANAARAGTGAGAGTSKSRQGSYSSTTLPPPTPK